MNIKSMAELKPESVKAYRLLPKKINIEIEFGGNYDWNLLSSTL